MPRIEMNLTDYLRVVRKRKRIIILSFILVIASTFYYTSKQTPIYSTSSKVRIEQRKTVAAVLAELITWSPGDEMASQANFIRSYQVMEKVAEELGRIEKKDPDAQLTDAELARQSAIVRGLQGQISTQQVEMANIISIGAISSNPVEAADLANKIAEVYRNTHFQNKIKEASNVKEFVEKQLANYLDELRSNETMLQEFRQENPLITERDIRSAPAFLSDRGVETIKEEIVKIELKLASFKSKYTDEHPEVISTRRELERAKNNLAETLGQFTAQQRQFSTKEIELIQLKRNITVAEDIYMMFKQKYEEARIMEAEKAEDVTIIEYAMVPSRPIRPDVNFNIMISIFSGILIGLIMAFVTESLDTTIGRVDDIEELLKVPVLGIIPSTSLKKGKKFVIKIWPKKGELSSETSDLPKRLVTLFEPSSIVAEAYKSLRTSIDLTGLKKIGNSIVITSSAPQEGKTQTLANLAIAFAQSGQKVLAIGSDFRKPMLYRLFGVKRSPGLTEVLIGSVPWKDATNTATDMLLGGLEYEQILKTPGIENLHIMTCGERTPNPAELLSFSETDKLIKELKQNFDVVLFDSPPILSVTDSAILGSKTDGVILVYQAGRTSRYALNRAKTQLENVHAKIWGLIINNLKARLIEDVTPYQKYRYYGYYGEKKGK